MTCTISVLRCWEITEMLFSHNITYIIAMTAPEHQSDFRLTKDLASELWGVFERIWAKSDRVITAPHCISNAFRNKFSTIRDISTVCQWKRTQAMLTASNGNFFRVTGPLWGETNDDRWIPWSAPEQTAEKNIRDAGDLRRHRAHYDVTAMITGLFY